MEEFSKNELRDDYKNRTMIGGVFCIKCTSTGRMWLKSTKDMNGQRNKFEFFVKTNSCPEPRMHTEWNMYGAAAFSFVVLEELEKGETQTEQEFSKDIDLLLEIWKEKQNHETETNIINEVIQNLI